MAITDRLKKFDLYSEEDNCNPVSPELASLCSELTKALSQKIATIPIWFDYSKDEQQELIMSFLNSKLNEQFSEIKLTSAEKERISSMFFTSVYGFGSLDFLISQKDVSKIFVNSPADIYVEKNGIIEKSDVVIDKTQFDTLLVRLIEMSGKSSSVITFRLNNLLVTILREPVCRTKLILKKVSDTLFDFGYFERRDILDSNISEFLKTLIENRKKVLISSPVQCGKTAFLNAFINEADDNARMLLFEEGSLINTKKADINRFDVEDLTEKEQRDLITAALYYNPEYIFSDINSIGFNIEISELLSGDTGFVSTVRANSPNEALSFYTSVLVSRLKCTEKLAKMQFAKDYDYIVQLEKNDDLFVINSVTEVSTNKAGTPVFAEKLSFKSGEYKYNFVSDKTEVEQVNNAKEPEVTKEITPKKVSFQARFGK